MDIGFLSHELSRSSIEGLFDAAKEYGFNCIQFSFHPWCKGFDTPEDNPFSTLPNNITLELAEKVSREAKKRGIRISALTGFYNMISEDLNERNDGLYRLEKLASVCEILECNIINLCTGSRGAHMWAGHPDNNTVQAWHDITESLEQALAIAEHYKVFLGTECEASNVINTPEKARKMLDQMGSPWLKIIMDGANVFQKGMCKPENVIPVLKNAFDLLGEDIISVHGKDIKAGPNLDFTFAGNGIVDFDYFIERLKEYGYNGDMILHGAYKEEEVPESIEFMKNKVKIHNI